MKKSDFIKKIERAKKYSDKSSQIVDEIIDELEEDGVDINAYVTAPNSDNVADSITCYVQYDEWTPEEIWQAIKDISTEEKGTE